MVKTKKKIIIDGKPILFKSLKNTPPIKTIKEAYAKIPDDKKIPVVFQTKTQYLTEYIHNQEKKKNIDFTPAQERAYKKTELKDMKNIVSRYTTNHNPYIDRRVVFFTDTKTPKEQFEKSVMHEYGHELWEKNPKLRKEWSKIKTSTSPTPYGRTDKQEDFAESFMLAKNNALRDPSRNRILSDSAAQNNRDLFKEFDVNHDGRIDDKDMNILRRREKQGKITRDTRAKNSTADAMNIDVPEAYLFTDEWKLYGGPKNYNPTTHDSSDLKTNISNITSRHMDNLRENRMLIPEINMNTESRFGSHVSNLISTDISHNRKYVKTKGKKEFYEPQGKTGESIPIYTSSKRPSIPSGIYEAPSTDHPLPIPPPIQNVPNLSSITNKFRRHGIKITSSMDRDNTTPIGTPSHPGIIYDAAARINFAKQGIHTYNLDESPEPKKKLGRLDVYDTTHYDERRPYVNPNPKLEVPGVPKPKTVFGSETLYKYGSWLDFAQKAKAKREDAEEARQREDEDHNKAVQQLQLLDSRRQLSSPVSKAFSSAQLVNFSPDLTNNFGVIRAGITYTPYPVKQKKAFWAQYEDDDQEKKGKKLLKENLYGGSEK